MGENARVHIVVSGRVQGVLYRAGARQKARELGLAGWAHNLIDGKVELVAEGEKEKVMEFAEWCRQGPPLAKVENVEIEYEDSKGDLEDFEVREFGF